MTKLDVSQEELVKIAGTIALEYGHTISGILIANLGNIMYPLERGDVPNEFIRVQSGYNLKFCQNIVTAIDILSRKYWGTMMPYSFEESLTLVENMWKYPTKPEERSFSHEIQSGIASPFLLQGFYELILNNLYKNAIKTGKATQITTTVSEIEGKILTAVRDNGCGMSEENLERTRNKIFSSCTDGRGIGMTTTKLLLEVSSGTLNIESKVGYGTTVTFGLRYQK